MPSGDPSPRYRLADLVVDVGRRAVLRGSSEIHLSKLSFELLRTLLEAAPNVVSNEELTRRVWKGVVVGPETVTQRLKVLRDALGDDAAIPRYIGGLRGHGYRILPEVTLNSTEPEPPPPEPAAEPVTAPSQPAPPEVLQSVPRTRRLRRPAILLAAAALAVALTYVTVNSLRTPRQRGPTQTESASSTGRSLADAPPPTAATPIATTSPPGFAPPPHSVAVLPFINMSGDERQEYFSDGITEELLNSLAHINELQVAARTSSSSFKGKDTDLATIARKLNVRAVIEGSVRRSGRTIRVTAQLNDAVTGFHLWSETYDRDLGDVLKLQTEIAAAVAKALKITLLDDTAERIELGGTRNPDAFEAYLRGSRAYWGHPQDLKAAIEAFGEAVRLDPNYAVAFAARSIALNYQATSATDVAMDRARSDARRAIELTPELGQGHLALALVFTSVLEFLHASEEYARALTLAPGDARVLRDYALFSVSMGHTGPGLDAAHRALALDPLNVNAHGTLCSALFYAHRYREAITACTNALAFRPDSPESVAAFRGFAYYVLGDYQSARASCEIHREAETPDRVCLALTYDKLGRHADAEVELAKEQALSSNVAAFQYTEIYAQWGNTAKALEWLEVALRVGDDGLVYLRADPFLDPLRKEPRYQAIERALKFPD